MRGAGLRDTRNVLTTVATAILAERGVSHNYDLAFTLSALCLYIRINSVKNYRKEITVEEDFNS